MKVRLFAAVAERIGGTTVTLIDVGDHVPTTRRTIDWIRERTASPRE